MNRNLKLSFWILIFGIFVLAQAGCGKKEEKKPYEILTKTTPDITLLYFEHTGPYDQIGSAFDQLSANAAQKGISGNIVGIFLDNPEAVRAESLKSEVGMVVPYGTLPDSGYAVQEIPARKVVYAILKGPYGEIAKEYPYIMAWIERKGFKMNAPMMEIYLEAGSNVPPAQLVTEVQFPIKE